MLETLVDPTDYYRFHMLFIKHGGAPASLAGRRADAARSRPAARPVSYALERRLRTSTSS